MFNQSFFQVDFKELLEKYAESSGSDTPSVEFQLRDGNRYRVSSIELIGSQWISFRGSLHGLDTGDGAGEAGQVTCGYEMLSKINFLSSVKEKRVGFRMNR